MIIDFTLCQDIYSNNHSILFSRHHVDLMGLLDFEIWKTSRMINQRIPLQTPPDQTSDSDAWKDFAPHWN